MQTTLSKVTVPANYSDPELEAVYEQLDREQLIKAEVGGKHDGKINQPNDIHTYKVQTIGPLRSAVQSVIDLSHAKHQLVCDVGYVQKIREDADAKVKEIQNEEKQKAMQLAKARKEEKALHHTSKKGWSEYMRYSILAAFALVEGSLTFLVMKRQSTSALLNILLALAVMFIASLGLNVGAHYIASALTPRKRKFRYAIVVAAGLLFSLCLGYGRAQMNNEAAAMEAQISQDAPIQSSSALPFVFISFFGFLIALGLELRHTLSPEEKAKQKAWQEKHNEVVQLERELAQSQEEINSIESEVTHKTDWIFRRQVYARDYEIRLVSMAQKVVDKYESTDVDFRKDRQCPSFFGEKIDFQFQLYYQNLFPSQKQVV